MRLYPVSRRLRCDRDFYLAVFFVKCWGYFSTWTENTKYGASPSIYRRIWRAHFLGLAVHFSYPIPPPERGSNGFNYD
jgi:hypothetical protein